MQPRLIISFVISGIILSSCAIPKPHVSQSRNYEEFVEIVRSGPQIQFAYCGSDSEYHYFAQWRGMYFYTIGRGSYLKKHKVPKNEMTAKNEFPRTRDMNKWRRYHSNDIKDKFTNDFTHKGDTPESAR